MKTTNNELPDLRIDAKTMSIAQLAIKYCVSRKVIKSRLDDIGIKAYSAVIKWDDLKQVLARQAETMTTVEMAGHYRVNRSTMLNALNKFGFTAVYRNPSKQKIEALIAIKDIAQTLNRVELGERLGLNQRTVAAHAKKLGIKLKRVSSPKLWSSRKEELAELLAAGKPAREIAAFYNTNVRYLYKAAWSLGIAWPKQKRQTKVAAPKKLKAAAKQRPSGIRQTKTYTPQIKKTALIVYPENVKYTVAEKRQPWSDRLCNASSNVAYSPVRDSKMMPSYRS